MQAIEIAGHVFQQQGGRTRLSSRMALAQKGFMVRRITRPQSHPLVPTVRNRREAWIEPGPQRADRTGKRIGEIFVFAAAEAVPPHDDAAAEVFVARIERDKARALRRAEHWAGERTAVAVEILGDFVPRQRCDALGHGRARVRVSCLGCTLALGSACHLQILRVRAVLSPLRGAHAKAPDRPPPDLCKTRIHLFAFASAAPPDRIRSRTSSSGRGEIPSASNPGSEPAIVSIRISST